MKLNVTVQGVEGIEEASRAIKKAVAGALEAIGGAGAGVIKREARALVPVLSGALQKSIRYDVMEKSATAVTLRLRPHTPYAARIEYGYQDRDRSGRQFHNPAQPYMRPAFDAGQAEARAAMTDKARAAISAALAARSKRK